jgi:tight adherence protein B
MYDATDLAVKTLGPDGSRNIVLLSDGEDEGSTTTPEAAVKAVAGSDVTLDAVALGTGKQAEQMAPLAKAGNGTMVMATDAAGLTAAFESSARAVSNEVAVLVTVPEGMTAGNAPMVATINAGGEVITDASVAQVMPPVAVATGPRAADTPNGLFSNWWVALLAIAGIFAALFGISNLALNTVNPTGRKDGRIKRRLADAGVVEDEAHAPSSLGDSAAMRNAIEVTSKVVKGDRADKLDALLQAAGAPLRAAEWITVQAMTAAVFGLIGAVLTGFNPVGMIAFAVMGGLAPWAALQARASRRRAKFYEQLPDMQLMAGGLSAGYSLPQALDAVARESAEPMKSEIQRALTESRIGIPIEDSLEAVATRMDSKDFHWVVMAIAMNRQIGGNLGNVLRTVGETLRERERLRRNVKALTAEGKLSAWILAGIPFLLTGYMFLVRPEYIGLLFTDPLGMFMLLAGTVGVSLGIFVMFKMIKIEV